MWPNLLQLKITELRLLLMSQELSSVCKRKKLSVRKNIYGKGSGRNSAFIELHCLQVQELKVVSYEVLHEIRYSRRDTKLTTALAVPFPSRDLWSLKGDKYTDRMFIPSEFVC